MNGTRQAVLDTIRSHSLRATPHLVEQGFTQSMEFEDGTPSHHNDIDFWVAASDRDAVSDLFEELGAVRLMSCADRAWSCHDVYLLPCADGALLIDVKFGDLKVAALTLLAEADLLTSRDENNRFAGAALIADLLLRRLARGKRVDALRLERSQVAWRELSSAAQVQTMDAYVQRFGRSNADGIRDLLEGREPPQSVGHSLRMQVIGSSFSSFRTLTIASRKAVSHVVGALTRRRKPFGQFQRGSLTVISGTDGTGKSTTLDNVAAAIGDCGLRCKTIYLGRGRGNVPGVATLRNAVGDRVKAGDSSQDVYRVSLINKMASWFYAFEYFLRTLKPRVYRRILGYAVVCDRYCYDIALIRGGSASALRFARLICPTPDINVVLRAPADVILERKAERDLAEIEKQQAILAQIIDGAHARHFSIPVDTSKTGVNETRQQILHPILQLSHRDY